MAAKQPEKKDLSVLSVGTPRSHVIAEIGAPIHTDKLEDGKMDIYKFVQGYTKGVKVGRAFLHGVADIFTLGIWEALGTPIELVADGNEATLEVYYDQDDRVYPGPRSGNDEFQGHCLRSCRTDCRCGSGRVPPDLPAAWVGGA